MMRVVLDSGPLGRISNPRRSPIDHACWESVRYLVESGCRVTVPEISDDEIRRELSRVGATTGIARLDVVKFEYEYAPRTTEVMLRAAESRAEVRRRGLPTAPRDSIDGDAILAARTIGSWSRPRTRATWDGSSSREAGVRLLLSHEGFRAAAGADLGGT